MKVMGVIVGCFERNPIEGTRICGRGSTKRFQVTGTEMNITFLPTVCHTFVVMLVVRFWWYIKTTYSDPLLILVTHIYLTMY